MKKVFVLILLSSCINIKPAYVNNTSCYVYKHKKYLIHAKREKIIKVTTDTIKTYK